MKTQRITSAKRWLRSIDRATLVTMNPPASLALAATNSTDTSSTASRSTATSTTDDNRDAVSVTASTYSEGESIMTTIEIDRELEQLHEATVWSLNAALESGWDDAAESIAKSYAAEERSLLRRLRRSTTVAA